MRKHNSEKERFLRLAKEIIQYISNERISPSVLIVKGVSVGSATKLIYNKNPEDFLHCRGVTVLQLCKVLDKNKKGKYFERKLRGIFDHDKLYFYKWRKDLLANKKLGQGVVKNCIREKYVGENEYRFNISKMIEVLDYINDLEQDKKVRQQKQRRWKNIGKVQE